MKLLTYFFALIIAIPAFAEDKPTSIKICTPEWEYYTQQDGTGLYHELWKEIFTKSGVAVEIFYAPYKRCDEYISRNTDYDTFPGDYVGTDKKLITQHELGVDWVSVAYRKGTIEKWTGQSQLEGKRVAWERGYNFNTSGVITANVEVIDFTSLDAALKMLNAGRIDFIVDYDQALNEKIKELNLDNELTVSTNAVKGPKYYMTFTNTEKSKKLIEIWDREMAKLKKSGKLQELYGKYEDPTY